VPILWELSPHVDVQGILSQVQDIAMHDTNVELTTQIPSVAEIVPAVSDEILLNQPNIRILGAIGSGTLWDFLGQLAQVGLNQHHLILELTTEGGDADTARRIALEIEIFRRDFGMQAYFVGKTMVYSAGVTIMSAFPISNRFLTSDVSILIHERRMTKTLQLDGPMQANIQILKEQLAVMENAQILEQTGFEQLIKDSKISMDQLKTRAMANYYLNAQEALKLGLACRIL
jgi:ATP-dependent protease ClpP protease subunit